jgi:VanZ family protein
MIKKIVVIFKFLFLIYLATVLFLCLYTFKDTGIDLSQYFLGIRADRIAHFIMFLPYPLSAWFAIGSWFKKVSGRFGIAMLVFSGIILAFVAETLQNLNPNRDFDPIDILANIIGILTGTILLLVFNKIVKHVWPGRLQ